MPSSAIHCYLGEIVAIAGVALQYLSAWALLVGFGMRISTSTHEIRRASAVSGLSEIWRLHGADGSFDAGRVLGSDFAANRRPGSSSQ